MILALLLELLPTILVIVLVLAGWTGVALLTALGLGHLIAANKRRWDGKGDDPD